MIGCSFLLTSITLYLILTSQINKVKSAKSQLVYIPEITEIIPVSVTLPIRGDPERWKDRMAEQQNGRLTKQWKNHPNPKLIDRTITKKHPVLRKELRSAKRTVNYKISLRIKTNVKSKYCKTKCFVKDLLRHKFHLRVVISCQICYILDMFWIVCFGVH